LTATAATAAVHRARVARILQDTRMKERERWINVWNYVLVNELQGGTQFLRAEPGCQLYVVLGADHRIISLPRSNQGDAWHAYFQNHYGYGEHEKLARFVYDALRSHVLENGTVVEMRRFAVYDSNSKTAYLSSYNGQLFKVEGSANISTCPQGEDGVFFADDDDGIHVKPDIADHGMLLDRLTTPNFAENPASKITPEQQRMALIIWMFALAFPDLLPTKPILLLEGTRGSGKTTTVTLMQLAFMGVKRPMILQRNKEDDFGVILLKKPIALLDNQDSYVDWLPDVICAYATAGVWTKRKLYSDDQSLTIKPHAFIAISTRNPASYRRDDVADRCVILRFERRASFVNTKALEEGIANDRPKLLGEYLWYVGRIVEELRANQIIDDIEETHRMADFAAFGRIVGKVLNWSEESLNDLMEALQTERIAFLNEEDPLVDILHAWIKTPRKAGSNVGRLINLFELHTELEIFAGIETLPWKESPRTLGQKLQSAHVERHFRVQQSNVGDHKAFRIWRHSDARLEIVPDDGLKIND
jgi:hypothetical protein